MTAVFDVRTGPGAASRADDWVPVCELHRIVPDTGVAALVHGEQVAVFRLADDQVYAVGNLDPFSGAPVLAHGLVGDHEGTPFVASPVYKERFALATGGCLGDPDVRVRTHAVRVVDGQVEVGPPLPPS